MNEQIIHEPHPMPVEKIGDLPTFLLICLAAVLWISFCNYILKKVRGKK